MEYKSRYGSFAKNSCVSKHMQTGPDEGPGRTSGCSWVYTTHDLVKGFVTDLYNDEEAERGIGKGEGGVRARRERVYS